ncbi:MAG: ABC transporter permease [Caldilineaceae bacterium]
MNKTLLVAWREFRQRVRSRGFLIQVLLIPILVIVVGVVTSFAGAAAPTTPAAPPSLPAGVIGYVDEAGLIQRALNASAEDHFRSFADEEAAGAALARGEITDYYIIPPNYRETGAIRWVGAELPIAPPNTDPFEAFLLTSLLENVDSGVRAQVRHPFNSDQLQIVQVGPAPRETANGDLNWLPFAVTLAVIIPLFTGGGYLFQSLVQEKSSRVMEILLLSLRPYQLLSGKVLGLGVLTLVQYLIWALIALVALPLLDLNNTQALSSIDLTLGDLFFVVLYALGGYLLYAALMAGIGAVTSNVENNRAWIFIVTLPMLLPIYVWTAIVAAPNGRLAVVLSLFPFSAPAAMLMRLTATAVPRWQLGISLLLLALTGLAMLGFMARLFRAQTLLSGETLSLRRVWTSFRS